MTTNNLPYARERSDEATASNNKVVASLGKSMGSLIDEIEGLRAELRRQHALNATDTPERMLESLSRHFSCQVRPVKEYCDAFTDWMEALKVAAEVYDMLTEEQKRHRSPPPLYDLVPSFGAIMLAIHKSSYLARRIYDGEKHRTKKCPVHQGHWSGLAFEPPACGCDLTGWLPEQADKQLRETGR
jgi:hypothetical protein